MTTTKSRIRSFGTRMTRKLPTLALVFLLGLPPIYGMRSLSGAGGDAQTDPIYASEAARPRYFIVIAVDKSTVPDTDLPFAAADADNVVKLLTDAGYKPLGSQPITGSHANEQEIMKSITQIRGQPDGARVVVYYSGHGAIDAGGRDLYLQLYGQSQFGEPYGLRFSSLLLGARGSHEYLGTLDIIIDACFSGSSAAVSSVTLDIAGPSTVVLASSSTKEESQKIKTDTGAETSAFTYALERATGADRDSVDSGDGFITYDELEQYSTITLKDWLAKGRILGPMHPTIWSNIQDFLVYDPSHVKNPNSLFRQFYLSQLLADQLGVKDVQLSLVGGTAEVVLPPLSKEVKLTASALSDSAPPVGKALKAFADGHVPSKDDVQQIINYLDSNSPIQGDQLTLVSARTLLVAGQHSRASSLYDSMKDKLRDHFPLREAAAADILSGQYLHAEQLLKAALSDDIKRKQASPRLGNEKNNLGVLFALQHKIPESETALKQAVILYSQDQTVELATALENLGGLYSATGQFSQAGTAYSGAINLRLKYGESDSYLAEVMDKYSRALASQNLSAEAKDFKSKSERMRSEALVSPGVAAEPGGILIPAEKP
jgi:Caspase domain